MRVSFLVYGVLYVVLEVVGYQLGQIGWAHIEALDVATALTDAFLALALCAATLVAVDLGVRRWGRSMADWHLRQSHVHVEIWDAPIGVPSWRPVPLAVTAERVEEPPEPARWTGNPYSFAGRRFPKDPGTLL
ncbi:hypothetical protein FHU33_1750 [Blastococcus colisei]|uniref:Uncharacterized protein n=1 Tax=Blastococcus colisei TaxID=1564162 RepID=A0A543PE44_9ACTN|nr:hypothetical protein [Blastococcus colisei]TQN42353.1 hypothetical protein FHU33_1750 [Blastococcus colisei]